MVSATGCGARCAIAWRADAGFAVGEFMVSRTKKAWPPPDQATGVVKDPANNAEFRRLLVIWPGGAPMSVDRYRVHDNGGPGNVLTNRVLGNVETDGTHEVVD